MPLAQTPSTLFRIRLTIYSYLFSAKRVKERGTAVLVCVGGQKRRRGGFICLEKWKFDFRAVSIDLFYLITFF